MTRALTLLLALLLGDPAAATGPCAANRIELETPEDPAAFTVVIADTPRARARGLMGVRAMDRDRGMLFLWDEAAPRAFWMKDTPLALDILFFDARGVLCGRALNAEPFSLTPRESGCDAKAALELLAGIAGDHGVRMGAKARHPAFGPRAAWPCR